MKTTDAVPEPRRGHLRDYWRVVRHGKWTVLAIVMVVSTLVTMATFLQTPIYRATASVEIQPKAKSISPKADFSNLGTNSWSWMAEERYINTQMEVIRSRELAGKVIKDYGLESVPRFSSSSDPAGALASAIKLETLLDTYVLRISIEDRDPEMARLLANAVAETYIESNIDSAVGNAKKVIDDLLEEIEPIKKSIAEKESQRTQLARSSAYYVPEERESIVDSRLAQLQGELTKVQITRGQLEATFNAVREIEAQGGSYQSLPRVAKDPLIAELTTRLYTLEQQVQKDSAVFRPGHPKLVEARKQLDEIPRRIYERAQKIIDEIKTQYAIERERENDLREQIRQVREEGLEFSESSSKIAILDAEIKEERRIYELIMSQVKEIQLNQETLVNNVRMLERAALPRHPVRPHKPLNIAAGILLGLILGVGAVFFADYLDNTIRTAEDVEQYLKLPLLALIPNVQKSRGSTARESFQTLRTSLLFASKGRSFKTVLITSAGPGEGKSTTIVQLARTLALAGDRVVLVDADLRRPTVHRQLQLPRADGLSNYITNAQPGRAWSTFLKEVPDVDRLKVITCGPVPPSPVELFGAPRFRELLEDLKEHFDWVLIDSPPLASLADSVVLASLAEMTVLVIKHNQNDRELIRRSVAEIRKVHANVVGAVLNEVDLRRLAYHDYYYTGYTYGEEGRGRRRGKPARRGAVAAGQDRT